MKIKLSKSQWEGIGKTAGWDDQYIADINDVEVMHELTPEERDSIKRHLNDLWKKRDVLDAEIKRVKEAITDENYDYFMRNDIIPFTRNSVSPQIP